MTDTTFSASYIATDAALEARQGIGAPSPQNVKAQLKRWRKLLEA